LQQQQQWQNQESGNQGWNNQRYTNDEYDSQEQDEDDDDHYQQQQCRRGQRYNSLNLDDDDQQDYDDDEQNQWNQHGQQNQWNQRNQQNQWNQHNQQNQWNQHNQQNQQNQQQNQHRRQQQQQHNCQPRFQHLQALEQANNHLASKLYQQAKQENDDKNTVVSPAAVQLALAAIQRGARGNTRRQIQRVAGAGLNNQQTQQAHAALHESLRGQHPAQRQTGQRQQAQIQTTTTIVVNQQNHAQQQFIQSVRACVNAQVKTCNFQRQPQQCRQQINRYVAQKTNGQLQQTVPQSAVTSNTKLVVVNTAQIRANWGRQFRNQQHTRQAAFFPLGSQQPKRVQVLQSQGQFNYYEDEQLQVVGVPTQQQELTLFVIVPKDKDGLNQVEKQQIQNSEQLKQLLEQTEQQQEHVQVQIPKFQIRHKIDAKQTLQKQGVQDAFDADQADLSNVDGQQHNNQDQDQDDLYNQQGQGQQLHVNKLIHQATIQINEQGINAARRNNQNQQQWQDLQWTHNQQQWQQGQLDSEDDEDDYEQGQQHSYRQQQWRNIVGQNQRRHNQQNQNQWLNQQNQNQWQNQQNQNQWQNQQGEKRVQANHAFAFAIKHNPSNQIVMIGRVVDAAQHPRNQQQQHLNQNQQQEQTINGVDQQ